MLQIRYLLVITDTSGPDIASTICNVEGEGHGVRIGVGYEVATESVSGHLVKRRHVEVVQ